LDTVNFKFELTPSDDQCPMSVEVWLDNDLVWSAPQLHQTVMFSHDFSDDDGEHRLRIVLGGKTAEHTVVDDDGNILKDATVQISQVTIDKLDVDQLFLEKCVYEHNFNGSQPDIKDSFHGVAGCNGTIIFEFSTPIYLWLLENM
jgi:hypothetical protein